MSIMYILNMPNKRLSLGFNEVFIVNFSGHDRPLIMAVNRLCPVTDKVKTFLFC